MDAKTFDKSRLPSRHVTEGPARAPHRSYYYAMGLSREQIHQPFVGVATCWNEAAPCNISLMRQAQAVTQGVSAASGTPREFCTITVTDGIAMGHQGMKSSLPSREVIADSIELTMRGHCYDALIGVAGCDKSLPGMMMAMCRLNVPSIFIYGGSILPGSFKGRPVTVQDLFEAVGQYSVGKVSAEDLDELEQVACPSPGSAARNSPPTPWPRSPRPSASHFHTRQVRPRLTRYATASAWQPARRSWTCSRSTSARATSSPARRLRMPLPWWRRLAARPTPPCTCLPSRMNAASISTCSPSPRC